MAPENRRPDPLRNEISWEEYAPRDEANRFRIYCRTNEGDLQLIATCATPEAVGVAIVTLGREHAFDDCALGVLDALGEKSRKWILRPWQASPRNVSDAGRVLARSKKSTRTG